MIISAHHFSKFHHNSYVTYRRLWWQIPLETWEPCASTLPSAPPSCSGSPEWKAPNSPSIPGRTHRPRPSRASCSRSCASFAPWSPQKPPGRSWRWRGASLRRRANSPRPGRGRLRARRRRAGRPAAAETFLNACVCSGRERACQESRCTC